MSLLIIASCLSFSAVSWSAALPRRDLEGPLTFTKDGSFQMTVFNDLHFGEGDNPKAAWGPQHDSQTVGVMNSVLDSESQQLVVLNGDLITGQNVVVDNPTAALDQIVAPLVSRNLPWASTYGNHDSWTDISRDQILDHEHRYPNSKTQKLVTDSNAGVSNYYLPVFENGCTDFSCTPKLILWFFDSRGGFLFKQTKSDGSKVGQANWVDQSVVKWFEDTQKSIRDTWPNANIPSLAFVHIPTYASAAAQKAGISDPGLNDDNPMSMQAQGWCEDGTDDGSKCGYGKQDVPFMKALTATPGLLAVFSGHDHGDSWCHKWDKKLDGVDVTPSGLNLCFGQHTGYGGYGSWDRGSRQIKVKLDDLKKNQVETWTRLESKATVDRVTLS